MFVMAGLDPAIPWQYEDARLKAGHDAFFWPG